MKKRPVLNVSRMIVTLTGALLINGLSSFGEPTSEAKKRPNLLFIMTDQQRFDAMSYAGNTVLKTPHMDRLAREGVWFENTYTQCAVCTPARASMLTGCSLANTKIIENSQSYLPDDGTLMPMKTYDEVLAENGYVCEYYGKWHAPIFRAKVYQNAVTAAGIQETELGPGKREAYLSYLNPLYPKQKLKEIELMDSLTDRPYRPDPLDKRFDLQRHGKDPDVKVGQSDLHGVTSIPAEYHISAFEAGKTIVAMETLKDETFSLTCSFHHPHPPYLAAKDYAAMYPAKNMIPPANIDDEMVGSPYLGSKKNTDEKYADPEMIQYFISEYYALVKEVDDWVGQILNKLDELELTDNTLVVFVSDHGEMLGSHGMRGKFNFYEESSRVPMMIRFPGRIKAGTRVKAPVSNIDLFATILDYLEMPAHPADGQSLRGLIEGTVNEDEAFVVTEWLSSLSWKPAHMVVKGGWKYMRPHDTAPKKVKAGLYNLNDDPLERKNLLATKAGQKAQAEKVAELEACYQAWMKRTSALGK